MNRADFEAGMKRPPTVLSMKRGLRLDCAWRTRQSRMRDLGVAAKSNDGRARGGLSGLCVN